MKQRILVMNGQRLVQTEQGGEWNTGKVEKAGNVKAGIYNLYLAGEADKTRKHIGMILHTDNDYVYQQDGKAVVRHARQDFGSVPEYGTLKSIAYDEQGRAVTVAATATLSASIKR